MKLTLADAAKLLRSSESSILRLIREKRIPSHQVHDRHRFHRSELLEWATARGMRVASQEFADAQSAGEATPRLAEALRRGGVHAAVPGDDRKSILRALVERMPIEVADRELLYDHLLGRRAFGSTGVGDGIAIPHVRHPLVFPVDRPSITLCYLQTPVEFEAFDAKPVDVVISLVSPTIRGHLFLLSRISAALHSAPFKRALLRKAPEDEVLVEAEHLEDSLLPPKGTDPA